MYKYRSAPPALVHGGCRYYVPRHAVNKTRCIAPVSLQAEGERPNSHHAGVIPATDDEGYRPEGDDGADASGTSSSSRTSNSSSSGEAKSNKEGGCWKGEDRGRWRGERRWGVLAGKADSSGSALCNDATKNVLTHAVCAQQNNMAWNHKKNKVRLVLLHVLVFSSRAFFSGHTYYTLWGGGQQKIAQDDAPEQQQQQPQSRRVSTAAGKGGERRVSYATAAPRSSMSSGLATQGDAGVRRQSALIVSLFRRTGEIVLPP